ncbi:MAG: hypothetical protein J0M20_07675 [Burkholderiales bacterium]|nr:hypothetical protein [Burkholderiales bacterium]
MQKSAHTHKPAPRPPLGRWDAGADKGQKFEPFWTSVGHSESRSRARTQKADQKR